MYASVSVIIPVYNRYDMLMQALQSVLAQTAAPHEVIVVDDGSTDIDAPRAARLSGLDPRLRYRRIAHCGCPGAVRNAGAELCSGDWIALLDSDDIWLPHKLELQLRCAADNPDAPLVHTRERWLRNGREVSQAGQTHSRSGTVFPDALVKCIIGPSTVMMRRDVYVQLGGFRADMQIAEDYEFWLRVCARHPVAYVDQPLVDKRAGHRDQLSRKYGHIERFRIDGLLQLVQDGYFLQPEIAASAEPAELQRLACAELARKCAIYAAGAARRGRSGEAARYRALAQRYQQ